MARLITYTVRESDMQTTLRFTADTLEEAFNPLIEDLSEEYGASSSRPFLTALAGPPGSGKSAVASVLKILLEKRGTAAVVLPMDGFHLENDPCIEPGTSDLPLGSWRFASQARFP